MKVIDIRFSVNFQKAFLKIDKIKRVKIEVEFVKNEGKKGQRTCQFNEGIIGLKIVELSKALRKKIPGCKQIRVLSIHNY